MFENVLIPVDLSDQEHSDEAIKTAAMLQSVSNGAIRLMTVIPAVPMVAEYIPAEVSTQVAADAQSRLKELVSKYGLPDDKTTISVRHGGVYHEVLEEAEEAGTDVIVMGSHHPAMSTYLLGSNAARIVRHAPCSVLVCR